MADSICILHVDDNPNFLDVTSRYLRRQEPEFDVITETQASEGLEWLLKKDCECVVSDYDMPGQNGIEFLRAVREQYPALPFILFTGKGGEEVASEAITAGATDYLQKQSSTEQYELLSNRIQNAVQKYRKEAAVRRSEKRYHNLVDTAPIPILLFNEDGRLVYANEAAVSFLGADSYVEIDGKPFTAFLDSGNQDTAENRFEMVMTEETTVPEIEYQVETVDGKLKEATVATAYGHYQGERVAQAMIYHQEGV